MKLNQNLVLILPLALEINDFLCVYPFSNGSPSPLTKP